MKPIKKSCGALFGALMLLTGLCSLPTLAQTFSTTGSLTSVRYDHTATLLNNGKVLVTGGYNTNSTYLASSELYDAATGTFSATGNLITARYVHTATLLNNGKVLVTGGYNRSAVASSELYDPVTGTFSTTGSLATGRYGHTATLLSNGKVLVTGGFNNISGRVESSELYDPATDTFSATGNIITGRYYYTATLLNNSQVLVTGGLNNISGVLASSELYDSAAGTFSTTGSMTTVRDYHTATLLNNGKVLVTGGANNSSTLASSELYDPTTGTFSVTGSLATARYHHTATLLNDGKVLVTGGSNDRAVASSELYDPATGTFSATGNLTTERTYHRATLLGNGTVLVTGGLGNFNYLASAELYTPAASLSINDVVVNEGNSGTTSAIFIVTLSVASSQTVTVQYGAIKGSTNPAVVSSDFLSTKGTLTFAPGEMTKTVTVPIVGDYVPEADETFIVKLSSPVNAPINDGQGLGTITNDDFDTTPPTVSFTTSTTTPMGTTPQTGGTVYNVIPAITGVAADADSGIARVQLRLYRATSTVGVYEYWNGTGWVVPGGSVAIPMLVTALSPAAGSTNVTWTRSTGWPTGGNFADGTYYLTAYAFDRAGKFASSARNFKKASDSTGPSVSFTTAATTPAGTTPVSGSTVTGTMPTITGIATDSASGVAKVELRLYRPTATAGVYENWTGSAWTTTLAALSTGISPAAGGANVSWTRSSGWPSGTDFADGTYFLRATAYDNAGNLTATLASNFKKVTSAGQALQPFENDEPSASRSDEPSQ